MTAAAGSQVKSLENYLPSGSRPADAKQASTPPAHLGASNQAASRGFAAYPQGRPSTRGPANQSHDGTVLWLAVGASFLAIIALIVVIAVAVVPRLMSRQLGNADAAIPAAPSATSASVRESPSTVAGSVASSPRAVASVLDDAELERIRKKIETGRPTREDVVRLASMEVKPQYRSAIAMALHGWIRQLPTMDDMLTLAVIRWSDAQTENVLFEKLGNAPGRDPAFFYALICVGGQRTHRELASLDYVSRADYPLLQQGQPEWVLFPEKFGAQAECEKLEQFFTDHLLESRHGPVRSMGCLGCQLCGQDYCLRRLGDMSENDIALDVKDLARKTWEFVFARQRSQVRN